MTLEEAQAQVALMNTTLLKLAKGEAVKKLEIGSGLERTVYEYSEINETLVYRLRAEAQAVIDALTATVPSASSFSGIGTVPIIFG